MSPMPAAHRRLLAAAVAWGLLLSLWLSRVFFLHAPEWVPLTHEGNSYTGRLLEFRDLLGAGYASPQWATHFRQGLGSPFFRMAASPPASSQPASTTSRMPGP